MRYRKTALLLAALLLFALSGCAKTPSMEARTVVDMKGRTVALLQEPITRVVALSPADCEILYALGAQGALVGRGEYCDYPAEARSIPAVQSNYETNIEQVLALRPQVVLVGDMQEDDEQIRALEAAGVAVVMTNAYHEIEEVYRGVALIGEVMDKNAEAAAVIADMNAAFEALSVRALARSEDKTIYFEISPLAYGLWTGGTGTFMDEIAGMLGVNNVFSDVEGWRQISEEQVLSRNPDYIVTITMYTGEGPTPIEEIMARPGWENVTAVKNGAILNLQHDELSRPAPRLAEGAKLLYDFIYGNDAS
ncbi:MAG: helical backbone metal receptor [Clostridia bacterium]|nr:helical backbone metal receptor [Clostridia bacterium]